MATGNKVQFAYIATGSSLPSSYPNPDTIYFLEESKEIRVGSRVIANVNTDAIDPATLESILEAYAVKNIDITGSGDNVSNITFNSVTGRISVTKSNLPVLAKGAATAPTTTTLNPGGTFEVLTDTSVSGHTITDSKTRFTLPKQINNILITTSGTNLVFTLVYSDGTTQDINYTGFGSAAFANSNSFATAAQGTKADAAMPANNGVATSAQVTLKNDPVANMDAATKQYVDNAVAGAASNLNFLGVSTTTITDGGTQSPTINGNIIPVGSLNMGDWVIYDNIQYIWDGTKWVEYGGSAKLDEYVKRVTAGIGLDVISGGSASDGWLVNVSHKTKYAVDQQVRPSGTMQVLNGAEYDIFGHVVSIDQIDLTNPVNSLITTVTTPLANSIDSISGRLSTDYYTADQIDGKHFINYVELNSAINDIATHVSTFRVLANSWTLGDGYYRSDRIAYSEENHYYDIHLPSNTSRALSLMCANADIHAKLDYDGIYLYAYGTVPTQNFDLEIVSIVTKENTISLTYDIGDDFLIYPSIIDALDARVTALETGITQQILTATNVYVDMYRWESSNNATYPYKAVINMPGVTADYFPVVQFSDEAVTAYDFSPSSSTGAGTVTIMCKTHPNTTVSIPSIMCYKSTTVTAS